MNNSKESSTSKHFKSNATFFESDFVCVRSGDYLFVKYLRILSPKSKNFGFIKVDRPCLEMRLFAVCALVGAVQGEVSSDTTETRETASSFLSRAQRIFFWEEAKQGNLERECIEEV